MKIPGAPELTFPQMDNMIIGGACLLALAAGFEKTFDDSDPSSLFDFHNKITQDCIRELGYCLHDRFGKHDGAWGFEGPIAYKLFEDLLKYFGIKTIYGADYLSVERNPNFWERMGFTRTGETRTYFDDYAEDEGDGEIEVPEIIKEI